jgi:hypothetical protein
VGPNEEASHGSVVFSLLQVKLGPTKETLGGEKEKSHG